MNARHSNLPRGRRVCQLGLQRPKTEATAMLSRRCKQQYEEVIPRLMESTASLKKTQDTINMSVSDNCLVRELYKSHWLGMLPAKRYSYAEGIGGDAQAQEALSKLLNRYFEPQTPVSPDHIVLAAGGSYALIALAAQICDPGDAIMIPTPYWPGLDIALAIRGNARIIPVDMPVKDHFELSCVQILDDAIDNAEAQGIRVKAILITNPSNPLGRCYSKAALQKLLDLTKRRSLHYISDEVYALSVYRHDEDRFTSILSLDSHSNNIHVIYSLSKDFGCNGIRLGALITQNNEPIRLGTALATDSQVSSVACYFAVENILKDNGLDQLVSTNTKFLKMACDQTCAFLDFHDIQHILPTSGLYVFAQLCSTAEVEDERRLEMLLRRRGVALAPGSGYHCSEPGWFRICFAIREDDLAMGLQRIGMALLDHRNTIRNSTMQAHSLDITCSDSRLN